LVRCRPGWADAHPDHNSYRDIDSNADHDTHGHAHPNIHGHADRDSQRDTDSDTDHDTHGHAHPNIHGHADGNADGYPNHLAGTVNIHRPWRSSRRLFL